MADEEEVVEATSPYDDRGYEDQWQLRQSAAGYVADWASKRAKGVYLAVTDTLGSNTPSDEMGEAIS